MQGQAPAVFPRQVRNERDMDAETGGRGQPLQRAQARSLGSSLIRYLIVQDVRRPVAPSTSNLVRDRATSPRAVRERECWRPGFVPPRGAVG